MAARIVGAVWTARVNLLTLRCDVCGHDFDHRADRWRFTCPTCGERGHLADVRREHLARTSLAPVA